MLQNGPAAASEIYEAIREGEGFEYLTSQELLYVLQALRVAGAIIAYNP